MATPTQAELILQLQNLTRLADEMRRYGESNAQNFVSNQDTLEQSLEGDHDDQITAAVAASRSNLNDAILVLGDAYVGHFRDWGRFIVSEFAEGSFQRLFSDLYDYFFANALTVQGRAITYGTPVAGGGNAGNGEVLRLTKDVNNFNIENVTLEAKLIECRGDQNTGFEKGKELFRISGAPNGRDIIESRGSGSPNAVELQAMHSAFALLRNPSFDQLDGSSLTVLTSIPSWDITTGLIANFVLQEGAASVYLPTPNDNTTVRSLRGTTANFKIRQKLVNIRQGLNQDLPYYLQIAWNRELGTPGTGTLVIRMGTRSATVAVAAQVGWQKLRITLDNNSWFRNFDEQDLDIEIEWTRTAGDISIDDVIFVAAVPHDGSWYIIVPGSTSFLVDDKFTYSDTGTITTGEIQRNVVLYTGRFLPSALVPSIADP